MKRFGFLKSSPFKIVVAVAMIGLAVVFVAPRQAHSGPVQTSVVDYNSVDMYIDGQVRDARIPGLALGIVHGSQIVHLKGFGVADESGRAVTAQTPFVIGSVSKSFTALSIMQLIEAGKVTLDAPVQQYLPWFQLADPGAARQLTVRELLNHTSGISTAAGVAPLSRPATSLIDQVRSLAQVMPVTAPGATYQYSNANYEILGLIVETVSGQPYGQYVRQHILDPLDMKHTAVSEEEAKALGLGTGHNYLFGSLRSRPALYRADFLPAGFLVSTAEDMAHYLIAQMNGGVYGATSILSPAGIAAMHQAAVKQPVAGTDMYYGMGWMVESFGDLKVIAHDGSTGDMHSIVAMTPDNSWGVVVLMNAESVLYLFLQRLDLIGYNVLRMLAGYPMQGSLAGLYIAFDVAALLLLLVQLRSLRNAVRGRPSLAWPSRRSEILSAAIAAVKLLYSLAAPILILAAFPRLLSNPWPRLVRTDVGMWVFAVAVLMLVTALIRVARISGVDVALRTRWQNTLGAKQVPDGQ